MMLFWYNLIAEAFNALCNPCLTIVSKSCDITFFLQQLNRLCKYFFSMSQRSALCTFFVFIKLTTS